MTVVVERFENHALGRPYHAALIRMHGRSAAHRHEDYYEVMVVSDGEGEHLLESGSSPLRRGDVVLLRPTDQHAIAGAVTFYNVAFPARAWQAFADLAELPSSWDGDRVLPSRRLEPGDDSVLRSCNSVLAAFQQGPTQLDLIHFWTDVARFLAPPRSESDRRAEAPEWLSAACAAMRRDEIMRAGVAGLQQVAHVSAAHLSRSMRRYYGRSPSEFVTQLRIERAATLLASTTKPITDIAYQVGFGSPSYFSRAFRGSCGMAPRDYRRNALRAFLP